MYLILTTLNCSPTYIKAQDYREVVNIISYISTLNEDNWVDAVFDSQLTLVNPNPSIEETIQRDLFK